MYSIDIQFLFSYRFSPKSPVSRRRREWTELDGTAVSRRSVAQVRVNSGDPGRCPKIRLKEPGPDGTSAGFQTDENRYYTLILAEKAEKRYLIIKLSSARHSSCRYTFTFTIRTSERIVQYDKECHKDESEFSSSCLSLLFNFL